MAEAHMTVSGLARAAGVNSETIRFYERRGLLPAPPRTAAGYRLYPPSAVDRIRFIRHAKALGFTLEEIEELLSLRRDPGCTCGDVKGRADRKIADIDRRIAALAVMRRTLAGIAAACPGDGPTSDCPILAALDTEET
ncbi:MAG: heavy metal-responsive transcriptional regulator [Magnetospirillum sp.]|nr:heavy metal-responsive transcriptional regulator [Magnetospirillum sp.]